MTRQGKDTTILQTTDKMNAFVRNISLWTQKILQENIFDMFPCLCKCKADNLNLDQVKNVIIAHLNGLQERFQHYFAEIDVTKYDWIRNPFLADPSTSGLSTEEEEQLIDLSSDQSLKMVFQTTPVPKFWISINGALWENNESSSAIFNFVYVWARMFSIGSTDVSIQKSCGRRGWAANSSGYEHRTQVRFSMQQQAGSTFSLIKVSVQ